jgi:hypothetical protein
MDNLKTLKKRAGRVRSLLSTGSSTEELDEDDLSLAYRSLRVIKVTLVIVATALTIARMLGWL